MLGAPGWTPLRPPHDIPTACRHQSSTLRIATWPSVRIPQGKLVCPGQHWLTLAKENPDTQLTSADAPA
jgi:hypothetical protein